MIGGYFGRRYDAPAYDDSDQVETPVGATCVWCDEAIADDDDGWLNGVDQASHRECWLRAVIGGANHITGRCSCCGGDQDPDPPGLSRREAARAAVRAFNLRAPGGVN